MVKTYKGPSKINNRDARRARPVAAVALVKQLGDLPAREIRASTNVQQNRSAGVGADDHDGSGEMIKVTTGPGLLPEQRESVTAIARRFSVADQEISLAPRQGQVNLTVFLGHELVLRLPRKPRFEQRLAKEAAVIRCVQELGIPTAGLVSFDATHELSDMSYIVLERLHGREIDDFPTRADVADRTFRSLARILTSLHSVPKDSGAPIHGVEVAEFSCADLLKELTRAGEIGRTQAGWLQEWFERFEARGARSSTPVLVHGDVMPSNLILNDSGEISAIIDWGSACWSEAPRDLAGFRTSRLPEMVDAYRDIASPHSAAVPGSAGSLEASVLWYQLFFALAKLSGKQSTSEERNWSAPREARLLELLRFLSADIPARWRGLLHEG